MKTGGSKHAHLTAVKPRELDAYADLTGLQLARVKSPDPSAEDLFAGQCRAFNLPPAERQHTFAKADTGRLWRFDFCWRDFWLAVEIEGIVPRRLPSGECVVGGRHGSVGGIIEDMEKYNMAALLGWTVLRFPQKYVKPKRAIEMTMRVLAARGWKGPDSVAQKANSAV